MVRLSMLLMSLLALLAVVPVQATTTSLTLMPGDTLVVTSPANPNQPPVDPPSTGVPAGQQIIWNPAGNSRLLVTGVGQNELRHFYFRTPTSGKRQIATTYAGGSQQINHLWVLKNQSGVVIKQSYGQGYDEQVHVGDTIPGSGLGGKTVYGLQPNTYYIFDVSPVNPDGSNSCTRLPCDYFIDLNNVPGL